MPGMRAECASTGPRIAKLAAVQHGVVTREQLYAAGVGRSGVGRRVEDGRLHRVHHGVYAVGHRRLSMEGRWMAAVLACGKGAVLSHHSAAVLWRLLDSADGPVHVSLQTTAGRRRRDGIRIYRRTSLDRSSVTERRGIPVTAPARTIADLRGTVSAARLRRAIRQAEVLGLRTGLDEATAPTRSELEDLFLRLCRRHRIPMPEVNVRIAGREVDFLWRRQRVVAETDGYRFHRGAGAFEDDHDRDLDLRAAGFDVIRFTFRQVTAEPSRVAASIAAEL